MTEKNLSILIGGNNTSTAHRKIVPWANASTQNSMKNVSRSLKVSSRKQMQVINSSVGQSAGSNMQIIKVIFWMKLFLKIAKKIQQS